MKLDARIIFIAGALTLGACSGNFATGTGMPQTNPIPPVNGSSPMPGTGPNGLPNSQNSALPSSSPIPAGTYAVTEAKNGFDCPSTISNYACVLKFNLPAPTPTPKPNGKGKKSTPTPSPSPTPSPTPSPSPSGEEENEAPTPTPSPTPATVSLKAEAQPKDAPKMVHTPPNTLDVVPLMMVTLTANGDFPISGYASAQFTLPKEQVADRGFAVQLFQESTSHKHTTYTPVWTFDHSTLSDDTLTFMYQPPAMTLSKGNTYVLVLYGDDKSNVTPSPSPTASATASASPKPSPTASASASASSSPDDGQ